LRDNGLTINPSKCSFAVSSVKFLGHMVSGYIVFSDQLFYLAYV
jgi:hypothetical protein